MKVLIVEPNGDGHYLALYVRHIVVHLQNLGWQVSILTTKKAFDHPSFDLFLRKFLEHISIYLMSDLCKAKKPTSLRLFTAQLTNWWLLRGCYQNIARYKRFDFVYIPTMDWIIKGMEVFGSPFAGLPIVALFMSPSHHRTMTGLGPSGRAKWIYKRLFGRLLQMSSLKGLLVIDEFFLEYCKHAHPKSMSKLHLIPDFGEITGSGTRDECRRALDIPPEAILILVYGVLTERKGIEELLNGIADGAVSEKLAVLIAGDPDSQILKLIESQQVQDLKSRKRLFLSLQFHGPDLEYQVFKASDYVWLGYRPDFYGSSGVLYQAASAGLRVIATKNGLIGATVRKHRLGLDFDSGSRESVVSTLIKIGEGISCSEQHPEYLLKFAEAHSSRSYVAAVTAVFTRVI